MPNVSEKVVRIIMSYTDYVQPSGVEQLTVAWPRMKILIVSNHFWPANFRINDLACRHGSSAAMM